jgi:nitric oxide dioxygenase
VLISGGVGVTPVLSMLHAAVEHARWGEIRFIHGAVDGASHAFRGEVRELAARDPRVRVHFRYSAATREDREGKRFDSEGVIDRAFLKSVLGGAEGEFYFCGPKVMMVGVYQGLVRMGVGEERAHYEFFGPAEALKKGLEVAVV